MVETAVLTSTTLDDAVSMWAAANLRCQLNSRKATVVLDTPVVVTTKLGESNDG